MADERTLNVVVWLLGRRMTHGNGMIMSQMLHKGKVLKEKINEWK